VHGRSCQPWLDPDEDATNVMFASIHGYGKREEGTKVLRFPRKLLSVVPVSAPEYLAVNPRLLQTRRAPTCGARATFPVAVCPAVAM
jgi:hypothetical protein